MTTPVRQKCPTSDLWGDRHLVTDRRWTVTAPDGSETALCSAACALAIQLARNRILAKQVIAMLFQENPALTVEIHEGLRSVRREISSVLNNVGVNG